MNFRQREDSLIQFFYVLPFAADEALVEATFISSTPLAERVYEAELRSYLAALGGTSAYDVVWRERGSIPMSTRPRLLKSSPRVYAIGGAGGLVKPSTGYAFSAIQRFSSALAQRLRGGGLPPPPTVRSAMMSALDRIFLAVIGRDPQLAPALFAGLFRRVEPDRLVRFLSDRPCARDVAAVVNAMPKWPFLRQALASTPLWLAP